MNIEESLGQVLNSQKVIGELFYEAFFGKNPQVKQFFGDVNLRRQSLLLTMALMVVERQYSQPFLATEAYLQYLGTRHCDWDIPRHLYPLWSETMLETLSGFHGHDWTPQLSDQWSEALDQVTEIMFQGYDQRFTV